MRTDHFLAGWPLGRESAMIKKKNVTITTTIIDFAFFP